MSLAQMKKAILDVYPGGSWALKVSKMSDSQIAATYYRLMNAGKLVKK